MKRGSFFLTLWCLLLCGCVPISEVGYRDDKVKVRSSSVIFMLDEYCVRDVITVYGRHYSKVRGCGSCYLEIPGKNALLFVTGRDGEAVVHIVDTESHKERHFPAYDSSIGKNIGGSGTNAWEKVESVSGDSLIISAARSESIAVGKDFRYRQLIDLKAPKFVRQELDYLDRQDQKVRHVVYEGGRSPWTQ